MLHGRLTGNKVVNWDIKVGATSNSIVLCSEGWIANIYIYTVCIYIFDYVCYRIWSTVWAAWRCSSLSWSSWPWWPLINSPVIQQLGQISSPLMWPRQLMETGSFSHPTELQVCLPPPTTIYFYFSLFLFNVIRARTFFFFFFFFFRGTTGEESGRHLLVGTEAFPAETPNQPGESAPLAWGRYTGSPAAEGLSWFMSTSLTQINTC